MCEECAKIAVDLASTRTRYNIRSIRRISRHNFRIEIQTEQSSFAFRPIAIFGMSVFLKDLSNFKYKIVYLRKYTDGILVTIVQFFNEE